MIKGYIYGPRHNNVLDSFIEATATLRDLLSTGVLIEIKVMEYQELEVAERKETTPLSSDEVQEV